jgi:predicted DNA-binding transcriptional regulator AlpA
MDDELVCRKWLERRYGKARSTIERWVVAKRLPKPVNPSGKERGHRLWRKSEVLAAEATW